MKYKTTAKALREGACNLRSAGYCDLQYLLHEFCKANGGY